MPRQTPSRAKRRLLFIGTHLRGSLQTPGGARISSIPKWSLLSVVVLVLVSSACGVGGDGGDPAFCDDWGIAITSFLEAESYIVDGTGPMPVEELEAAKLAGDRLKEMDWPSEVHDAMGLYFTTIDSGGPNFFDPPRYAEWEDANREIRDYLARECDIDQNTLDRFYSDS